MTELKVGLLALVTMLSVVFMSIQVTKNQSGFGDYLEYKTLVDDASGIFPKTPIKVAGITAGRIKKIELEGNNALITFEVLEQVKVTKGSVLKIKAVGFLGDKFLEVQVDTSSKEILPEGSLMASHTKGGMEGLIQNSNKILEDVADIVTSLKDAVAPLTEILDDTKDVMKTLLDISKDMQDMIGDNKEGLKSIVKNFESISEDLAYHADMNEEDSLIYDMKKIGPILDDVKAMSADLKNIINDVKKGKGTIGQFIVDQEISDKVKETLSSVQKMVGRVDSIRTELDMYSGYNSEDGALTEMGLRIHPSPERFYLFGVATSNVGAKKKTHTEIETDGVLSISDKVEYERDSYRFNLQLGRKIHNFSVRGGIFESTGGLGFDYDYQSIGTRLSLDVFDYREDIGINIKLYSEFQMWNVFYGKLSVSDLVSSDYRNYSVSAGLRFNDEDLKSIMGFLL